MMYIEKRYRLITRREAVELYLKTASEKGNKLLAMDRHTGIYAEILSRFDLRHLNKIESGEWVYMGKTVDI